MQLESCVRLLEVPVRGSSATAVEVLSRSLVDWDPCRVWRYKRLLAPGLRFVGSRQFRLLSTIWENRWSGSMPISIFDFDAQQHISGYLRWSYQIRVSQNISLMARSCEHLHSEILIDI